MRFIVFTKRLAPVLVLLMWSAGLWADSVDPFPEVNPYAYYGNMMMSVKVTNESGDMLQNVIVAVYSGNELRGKGSPTDSGNPGVTYLTVFGNSTGEPIFFKVFLKDDGYTYEVDDNLIYTYNGITGSRTEPYIIKISPDDKFVTLKEADGTSALSSFTGVSQLDVQFERTFTAGKASTVCLPFAMTSISGGKVYEFVDVTYDSSDGWVATMQDASPDANLVTATVANTPYLFLPDNDGPVLFSGTIDNVPASIEAGATISSEWTFNGTYSRLDYASEKSESNPFSGTVFGFAAYAGTAADGQNEVEAGQFVKAAAGAYIQPFRAFLTYSGSNSALQSPSRRAQTNEIPARITVRLIGREGLMTAVGAIDTTSGNVTIEQWYDMSGRPIEGNPSVPGMYLNSNGKKVLINE